MDWGIMVKAAAHHSTLPRQKNQEDVKTMCSQKTEIPSTP
jgi:hypothetical protein